MINNRPKGNTAMTHAERLARFSAATPTINMPPGKADRSKNGQRPPAPARKRRFIR
jgi:hypothetical protein